MDPKWSSCRSCNGRCFRSRVIGIIPARFASRKYDIVVNIQGDEPLIEPEIIDGIVKALQWMNLVVCMQVIKVGHETHGVDTPEDVCRQDRAVHAGEKLVLEQSKILLDDFGVV
ncbi:hypothetical protein H5410_038864 [Solanum commersonii]|uniref:3-deoxy-manno-octulosonate cytidylyltransferase n=1 Tax=Solanum commersonii TaxID=4109 RepID=A0A9J5YDH1_SOLCO|nr:hypothetical protein H5410_038864 [Solanum commersonii]